MTTEIEEILKEFDEEHYDEAQFECDVHDKIKSFLSTSLTSLLERKEKEWREKIKIGLMEGMKKSNWDEQSMHDVFDLLK